MHVITTAQRRRL